MFYAMLMLASAMAEDVVEGTVELDGSSKVEKAPEAAAVSTFDVKQVASLLEKEGLGEHTKSFAKHKIDGAALLEVTEEEMKDELGMKLLGPRKQLAALIRKNGGGKSSGGMGGMPGLPDLGALLGGSGGGGMMGGMPGMPDLSELMKNMPAMPGMDGGKGGADGMPDLSKLMGGMGGAGGMMGGAGGMMGGAGGMMGGAGGMMGGM